MNNIIIKEYDEKYAEQISNLIIENLFQVNIKDYGILYVEKFSNDFTFSKIKENFKKRTKVLVALENDIVVGTAGLDKSWYNDNDEYWILTVFIKINYHGKGIGKSLIKELENFANKINAKKLVVPASITGCEFYHKLGYNYSNGKKELNNEQMYMMEKIF